MTCPVCNRSLNVELSICPSCGAMRDDSVREESVVTPLKAYPRRRDPIVNEPIVSELDSPAAEPAVRYVTAELAPKNTSPTLADFVSKTPTVPDWRLKIQNSIRQRGIDSVSTTTAVENAEAVMIPDLPARTSGANALKASPARNGALAESRLAKALNRIDESRKKFEPVESTIEELPVAASPKQFPFNIVSRSDELVPAKLSDESAEPRMTMKPRLVSSLQPQSRGLDTNQLVPIPDLNISTSFDEEPAEVTVAPTPPPPTERIEIKRKDQALSKEIESPEAEDADNLAPLQIRFNAALFDVIICLIAVVLPLSPLIFSRDGWVSFAGVFAFAAVFSAVLFSYLTASMAYFGQTLGMRMFSIEIVSIHDDAYPTMHQAAVNSSLYILSLFLGGIGFLPMLFNEEKRGAPDLLAGTVVVKEL